MWYSGGRSRSVNSLAIIHKDLYTYKSMTVHVGCINAFSFRTVRLSVGIADAQSPVHVSMQVAVHVYSLRKQLVSLSPERIKPVFYCLCLFCVVVVKCNEGTVDAFSLSDLLGHTAPTALTN